MTQYEEWEREQESQRIIEGLLYKYWDDLCYVREVVGEKPKLARYLSDNHIMDVKRAFLYLEEEKMVRIMRKEILNRKRWWYKLMRKVFY